jgi:hypothetical protein
MAVWDSTIRTNSSMRPLRCHRSDSRYRVAVSVVVVVIAVVIVVVAAGVNVE